ncbi:MAG: VOC family protein [Anaerolineaceae bacterium]|nr:VOC family protein [Anaerolineaceae bacterium]
MPSHPIVFWELATQDQEKSADFFRKVFDWEVEMDERLGFYIIKTGPVPQDMEGGIFTLKKAKLPFVAIYIRVDDIEERAKMIAEAGGLITEEPNDIGSGTKICLFNDPSGVTFAMIQPAKKAV